MKVDISKEDLKALVEEEKHLAEVEEESEKMNGGQDEVEGK